MSQVFALEFNNAAHTDLSPDGEEDSEILKQLKIQRLKLIETTNYLESLCARLLRNERQGSNSGLG